MRLIHSRWLTLLASIFCLTTALPVQDLDRLAGQHVIYSYSGLTPPQSLFNLVGDGKVGGIILFKANIGNNTAGVIERLQSVYEQSSHFFGAPLLIMTDQEGGEVRRVSGGPLLTAKQVGESSDPAITAIQAGIQAYEALSAVQINTNLAPVLDVYRESGNFIDEFQRSYGNTSRIVAECAAPFLATEQSLGIVSTAKHFPGLGAALESENTDLGPVTIDLSLTELRTVDEVPYVAAMAAGIKMVMASWAVYPALDAKMPSGLSRAWIQQELRGRLGFKGVTITDAIEAGALKAFGGFGERAVLATQAGMDLILASAQNVTEGELARSAIAGALADGSISRAAFDAASKRIFALRRALK